MRLFAQNKGRLLDIEIGNFEYNNGKLYIKYNYENNVKHKTEDEKRVMDDYINLFGTKEKGYYNLVIGLPEQFVVE